MAQKEAEVATAERRPRGRMYWWHGTDLTALVAELTAKGLDNVRLELRMEPEPMFHVVDVASSSEGVITKSHGFGEGHNFSHVCPPDCPE